MVATLGSVLTVGVLTTIYSQEAFALVVTGENGGDCSQCTGMMGGNGGPGGIGTNGANANGGHAPNMNGHSHSNHVTAGQQRQ
jgi:hypothetical protein